MKSHKICWTFWCIFVHVIPGIGMFLVFSDFDVFDFTTLCFFLPIAIQTSDIPQNTRARPPPTVIPIAAVTIK